MKKTVSIILILLFLIVGASCIKHDKYGTYQKEIDVIYVYHSGFGQRTPEYKIDLKEKKFYEYSSEISANYVPRDKNAKNEGFSFISDLDEENIANFIRSSARYGFTKWEDKYVNPHANDGHQWGVRIVFADKTEKQIYGSNKYPHTYKDMIGAFYDLTDTKILWINGHYDD